jgi:hypothetical protein
MLLRESQFERATELFYEAAAVPELWPQALESLADACGALGVCLYPVGPGPDDALCAPRIRGMIDVFLSSGWLKTNPYMRRGLELTAAGWQGLITSEDMLTPDQEARDPYLNEFHLPAGFGARRAGMVLATSGSELAVPIVFERHPADGPYTRADIAKMNRLVAKLKPAATFALKVGFSAAKRIVDGLSGLGREISLLGPSGRVLYMPKGFERHLGDAFGLRNGFLSSWDANTQRGAE